VATTMRWVSSLPVPTSSGGGAGESGHTAGKGSEYALHPIGEGAGSFHLLYRTAQP
jgi:hypothetical protein